MYQRYYDLREMPFNITPDPRFLFLSPTHQEALAHLRYGIEERKGFMVLTGEVGCGKTTICRQLLDELDPAKYKTALILNPRLNENELVHAILKELGEDTSKLDANQIIDHLNEVLLRYISENKEIVLIIDESQNLSFETLEHIRLLSNLETNTQKLLQIILLGQPELKEKIKEERLRQLRQRILVHHDLRPLTLQEVENYVQHRLTLAGSRGRPRFTARALRTIYKATAGIPRLVNNVCDKSILAAYIRESDEVNYWDVRRAVKELIIT